MSGLFANSVPTISPRPVTTLMTPGGKPASWKASINTSVCIALISLGLMTTVHPAAIAGATLIAIEPALEFHGVNMPTTPAGSITTLDVPTVLARSKFSRTSLKCRKMFAARLLEPFRTVLRCAVFHDRRLNELIHSLGHGVVQPLQAVHPVFLATLRKGVEGLFRSTDGFSGVDFVCHGDLANNIVVGRVHQIDDLGSMGCDELAIDIGAIKGSYWSRGFMCFHLCHPSRGFGFNKVAVSLRTPAHNFSVAQKRVGVTSKRRQCSCRTCQTILRPRARRGVEARTFPSSPWRQRVLRPRDPDPKSFP